MPPIRKALWDYYDRRVAQGVPGLANARTYWSGLGVETTEREIAEEAMELERRLRNLDPLMFADVGSGPGTFTAMLPGWGLAVDQSDAALRVLLERMPAMPAVRADAGNLPLRDGAVARFFAAHLYGLLLEDERRAFLSEARRVAAEVLLLDAGRPTGVNAEEWQHRTLLDGSQHRVFRRHFAADQLASEIRGEVLFGGRFYVLVRSRV